jgi:hypothetical protein
VTHRAPLRWFALRDAAQILSLSPDALRKQFERNVVRAPDGGIEAVVDGVRARKFANRWRVSFGERWSEPEMLRSDRQASDGRGRGGSTP